MRHYPREIQKTQKYRKEAIGDPNDATFSRRAERAIDRAEDWLGRLSRAQKDAVRAAVVRHLQPHARVLEQRQEERRMLVAILRKISAERPPKEAVIALLRGYTEVLVAPPGKPEHQQRRAISAGNAEITALLVNLATDEQRERARDKLRNWSDDFRDLAKRR